VAVVTNSDAKHQERGTCNVNTRIDRGETGVRRVEGEFKTAPALDGTSP